MSSTQATKTTAALPKGRIVRMEKAPHLKRPTYGAPQRPGLGFLDLPPEVRNMIYEYALGTARSRVPCNPRNKTEQSKRDERFNILRLCRQIGYEAGTLFGATATAYIPITTTHQISDMLARISDQNECIRPLDSTILAALNDVKDLHLHLHTEKLRVGDSPLFSLLKVLQHISRISAQSHPNCWGNKRRQILVHLNHVDHLEHRLAFLCRHNRRCTIRNIILQMGKIEKVDWTLCYYVPPTPQASRGPESHRLWQASCLLDFHKMERLCQAYSNIRLRPEIRDSVSFVEEGKWPVNFCRALAADCTPSSTIWPTRQIEGAQPS